MGDSIGATFLAVDSIGLTILGILVVIVIVVVIALVVSRRPGQRTPKPQQPRRRHRTEGGERPVHLDPDPDRTAGGRARFVPPFGDRKG